MEKIKILIDTDIGDDIDDSLAIGLALKMEKEFSLIGVTTVFMDTKYRAKIVRNYIDAFGYNAVPIYAGYSVENGSHPLDLTKTFGKDLITDFAVNENPEDAIDFIIDSCYKYKKELTLIAIGPFTNIAKVIKKDKNALKQINKVVIMGGAFYKQYSDWNVFCDPTSAKVMFENLDNLFAYGADVTHKLPLSEKQEKLLLNYNGENKGVKLLVKHINAWQNAGEKAWGGKPKLTLHDPLAVYSAFSDKFTENEKVPVLVIDNGAMKGFTFNQKAYTKSHLNDFYKDNKLNEVVVAKEIDANAFTDEFCNIIIK